MRVEVTSSIQIDESVVENSARSQQGLREMVGSPRRLLVIVFMAVIFTLAAQPITDPDFWWHLKTGQYILETRSIPHTDIFSTLRFGSEWVTHEWLSEVTIYLVFRLLSFGGLIVVFSLLIAASFWLVYQQCRKRGIHPYVAGGAVLMGALATMPTWGVRPQIFSLLLASIFINFLDRYSRREAMPSKWWLVPLMALWVNLHAGFAFGLVLIALTITGLLLDWWWLRQDSFADVWRRVRPLGWLLIICAVAVLLNPNGARLYSYPFETLSSPAMMQYIQEWRSPDFHNPLFQVFGLLLLATFSALALSRERVRPNELLILTVTAWAAFRSGRNVTFFALVATPILARHAWSLIENCSWAKSRSLQRERDSKSAPRIVINLLLLGIVLAIVALGVKRAVAEQPTTEAREFPAAAADFMRNQKTPQPIFNEYTWGGYLIWKLYPDYRVYIDGRADVYGDELMREFLLVNDGKPDWRQPLDAYGIHTVVVKREAALASLLRQDSGWRKIFEDKQAVIFIR